jgi:four helix bundle protein
MKKYLLLNDIGAYTIAFHLSNYVWNIVLKWEYFAKDTIGKQFVRAIDSISANIAEGFGRYGKKDKILFYRYSYGSIKESLDWNEKSKLRKLINKDEYTHIAEELNKLPKELHFLIRFTNEKLTI